MIQSAELKSRPMALDMTWMHLLKGK